MLNFDMSPKTQNFMLKTLHSSFVGRTTDLTWQVMVCVEYATTASEQNGTAQAYALKTLKSPLLRGFWTLGVPGCDQK